MELKWLEDFLTLVDCGSFSKAAVRRNVTQPAFSRRIQKLEDWFDVPLVDRSTHPVALLPNAVQFVPHFRQLVAHIHDLQSEVQKEQLARNRISIASQHTLTVTLFPQLLDIFKVVRPDISIRLRSVNRSTGVDLIRDGHADLLLCYDTPPDRIDRDLPGLERAVIGSDRLVPVSARTAEVGQPIVPGQQLTMLRFPRESHLGSVVERECLRNLLERYAVTVVCEAAFTVGLKALAVAGMGFAWLPETLVQQEMQQRRLVSLQAELGSPELSIALYRYPKKHTQELETIWALTQKTGVGGMFTPTPGN